MSASCIATAQTFKEGSIRLKGGQEQPGLIGKVQPGFPESVEFKSNNGSEIQIFKADEIEGYTLDGIFFSSYHQNAFRDKDWVFAEILADGDLILIRRNNMYFIKRKSDAEFTHLGVRYKATLMRFGRDCPILFMESSKRTSDKDPVVSFVKEYNECVASKKPNLKGMPRVLSIGLQGGYDYTLAKFPYNSDLRFLSATKQYDKAFFQGGLELSFKHYRVSRGMGFYTGVLFNSNSYSGINRSTFKNSYEVNEYSFSYKELRIPLGLEIRPPTLKKFTYHVRGGALFSHLINFKSDRPYQEQTTTNDPTVIYIQPAQMTSYKPSVMWGGSCGVDYKIGESHIRLQAGWYTGQVTATTNKARVEGKITSVNIMTTYIF